MYAVVSVGLGESNIHYGSGRLTNEVNMLTCLLKFGSYLSCGVVRWVCVGQCAVRPDRAEKMDIHTETFAQTRRVPEYVAPKAFGTDPKVFCFVGVFFRLWLWLAGWLGCFVLVSSLGWAGLGGRGCCCRCGLFLPLFPWSGFLGDVAAPTSLGRRCN